MSLTEDARKSDLATINEGQNLNQKSNEKGANPDSISRNKREWNDDEFERHGGSSGLNQSLKTGENDPAYNFLEKKEQTLYKSMQKTLKSDKDIDGQNLPISNDLNPKNRSQQKP